MDSDSHEAAHACSHLCQLLLPARSGKESLLFSFTKDLKHTAKTKFYWFHSKHGSPWGLQGSSQVRLCRGMVGGPAVLEGQHGGGRQAGIGSGCCGRS